MSNSVYIHLEYENPTIKIDELCKGDEIVIPVLLGDDVVIFATENQLEDLFNKIDKKLHKKTYSYLEDEVLTLSDSLDVANEALTTLREIARGE